MLTAGQSLLIVLYLMLTERGPLDLQMGAGSSEAMLTTLQSGFLLLNQVVLLLVHLTVQVPIAYHKLATGLGSTGATAQLLVHLTGSREVCPRLNWGYVAVAVLLPGTVLACLAGGAPPEVLLGLLAGCAGLKAADKLGSAGGLRRFVQTASGVLANEAVSTPLAFTLLNVLSLHKDRVFIYSLLPLVVLFRFDSTRSVVQAVTTPISALAQMAFLALIALSIVALGNFLWWPDAFPEGECDNYGQCFVYTMYRGTTYGDGIGDFLGRVRIVEGPAGRTKLALGYKRVAFDFFFFLLYTIILFNLVAGIIIDTFGALRDDKFFRSDKLENFVFVSGLSRSELERAAMLRGASWGFDAYVQKRQHTWNYMAWIFHLLLKQREEMTGPEQYCLEQMQKESTSWLPVGRALALELDSGERAENPQVAELLAEQRRLVAEVHAQRGQLKQLTAELGLLRRQTNLGAAEAAPAERGITRGRTSARHSSKQSVQDDGSSPAG